jgi:RNA polymerase sigma-70 factor (ECF subfamily)
MGPLEPEALGCLYRRYAPALRLYVRQWEGSAEDIVHDAFVQLAIQSPPPQRVVPWLYRVVRNAALTASRSANRRRRREAAASAPEAWFAAGDDRLNAGEAALVLAELPLELREVVVARIWGELTFDEVARLVGCSLPTAHRRFQSGLTHLRKRLEGRWTPDPKT